MYSLLYTVLGLFGACVVGNTYHEGGIAYLLMITSLVNIGIGFTFMIGCLFLYFSRQNQIYQIVIYVLFCMPIFQVLNNRCFGKVSIVVTIVYTMTLLGCYMQEYGTSTFGVFCELILFLLFYWIVSGKRIQDTRFRQINMQVLPARQVLPETVLAIKVDALIYTLECEFCFNESCPSETCGKCLCNICLESMHGKEVTAVASCVHSFHIECWRKYELKNTKQEILCPTCRTVIS